MNIYIKLLLLIILTCKVTYSQDFYKVKCNVTYDQLILDNEKYENMIGDTVFFDIESDHNTYAYITFSNNFVLHKSHFLHRYLVVSNVDYKKENNTMRNTSSLFDTLNITLQSLSSNHTFSFKIVNTDSYLRRKDNNKIKFIRKSVYNHFKNELLSLRFDTDIGMYNDTIKHESDLKQFPYNLISNLDTNSVKSYNIDSLKRGWKVEEVFIFGSADLFSNIDSINYAAECFDNSIYSMWYSSRSICLLTSNYLGHKQIVNVFSIEGKKGLYSGIPTVDIGKEKRDMYGDMLWYKSRFLSFTIDYNCKNNEDNLDNCLRRSYPIEPVIQNDSIIYFKNASLAAFKLYYTTKEIAKLSFQTLLVKHQYLFNNWFNEYEVFPSKPSLFYSIIKKRFKSLQPITYSKGVTKLTYRMIFGSSETNFYFLGNEYLVDL